MSILHINNFSGLLNVLDDPREIAPLNAEGVADPAECVQCDNVELSGTSLITSPGYQLHSSRGSGTGGVKWIANYELNNTARNVIIVHDDDVFEVEAADTVWVSVGDYGTAATNVGGVNFKGTGATVRHIVGNDTAANVPYKLTRGAPTIAMAALAGTPPDGYVMAEYNGYLFIADGPTLYYSDIEDEDDFAGGGSIGFNGPIMGLHPEDQSLVVGTREQFYEVTFQRDATFNLSVPLKQPIQKIGGCRSHKSLVSIFSDVYYLGNNGIESLGFQPQINATNRRIVSPSYKILPLIKRITPSAEQKVFGIFKDKRAFWAVALDGETNNDSLICYDWDYNAWYMRRSIPAAALAVSRNAVDKEELYFGSSISPELYKMNTNYSYNGSGYERTWKSKKFNFGDSTRAKKFNHVKLTGSMYENTVFFVKLRVDDEEVTYQIDNTNLVESLTGAGYWGDEFYGAAIYGGELITDFVRFEAKLEFAQEIREGSELQVTITNDEPGQPWKIDTLTCEYNFLPTKRLKPAAVVSTTI